MKLKLTALSFLVLLLSSCNQSNFEPEGKLIIAGKILNFEKHKEIRQIDVYQMVFFNIQRMDAIKIEEDGSFRASIPFKNSKDFFIIYGKKASAYFIGSPNDSILLTIDANILNDSKNHFQNDLNFVNVIGGNRVEGNKYVNEFLTRTGRMIKSSDKNEAIKTKSPIEFLTYQDNIYQMKSAVLDSFLQANNTEIFEMWAKDNLKYNKLLELVDYARNNARLNKINADSIHIPEEYYKQIVSAGINDTEIFSHYHYRFLQNYYVHLYIQARKEGLDLLQYINTNATGFSKDIALAKYYYGINKKSDTQVEINSELIKNEHLKSSLILELNKQETKRAEQLEIKAHSTYVDSLFSKYKGKVVYVDFWATWCGPCLKEFPYSVSLMEQFKDKPIEFLFLCNQSTKENWQKTIAEKELKGTHILLDDKQFAELKSLFEIRGIPHYVLINKQGGFINNAPRPSDKNIAIKINELLNK